MGRSENFRSGIWLDMTKIKEKNEELWSTDARARHLCVTLSLCQQHHKNMLTLVLEESTGTMLI